MRDLRPEILERLNGLNKRRESAKATYERELKLISDEEGPLKALFLQEYRRFARPGEIGDGGVMRPPTVAAAPPGTPLPEFFEQLLRSHPRTKDELREAADAAGYFAPESSSGARVTHMTIVNLLRHGRIVPNGSKFALSEERKEQEQIDF